MRVEGAGGQRPAHIGSGAPGRRYAASVGVAGLGGSVAPTSVRADSDRVRVDACRRRTAVRRASADTRQDTTFMRWLLMLESGFRVLGPCNIMIICMHRIVANGR